MSNNIKNKSRRNFIKKGFAGLTGAILVPSVIKKDRKPFNLQNKAF
jgi:hypothetical protein